LTEEKNQKKFPYSKTSIAIVCDINESMLNIGKERSKKYPDLLNSYSQWEDPKLEWVVGDAQELPIQNESIDCYTIAFGLRNCTKIEYVLKEAFRVLKKGGRFLCLEFSKVENPFISRFYSFYSFNVIPVLGQLVVNDKDSYQYLVESIEKFPNQEQLRKMIECAGFIEARYENLSFGIAAIHSGLKY